MARFRGGGRIRAEGARLLSSLERGVVRSIGRPKPAGVNGVRERRGGGAVKRSDRPSRGADVSRPVPGGAAHRGQAIELRGSEETSELRQAPRSWH
jgi:hypothetical protein